MNEEQGVGVPEHAVEDHWQFVEVAQLVESVNVEQAVGVPVQLPVPESPVAQVQPARFAQSVLLYLFAQL